MHSFLFHQSTLLLLALRLPFNVVAQGSFFVLGGGDPLESTRLDPNMSPGTTPSNHVHEIYGGDKFQANWDFQTAQSSTCNNLGPKADHSNYWFPALYFHGADGSFTKVSPGIQIYYHFDTQDNGPRTMFPDGFKMISGNAMLRRNDGAASTSSINWICHGPELKSKGAFPKGVTSCPAYPFFSSEIWFPFCWDGVNEFNPKSPFDHVVFGDKNNAGIGGKCPSSHPKALPQLFMEFHYDISKVANQPGAQDPWVLAPGDPTGYAAHADFVNGWEDKPGSLKDAIAVDPADPTKTKCYTGEAGADKCFAMLADATKSNCKLTPTVQEDVFGPLKALPGCNPIQAGPQDATIQTGCAGYKPGTTVGGPVTPPDTVPSSSVMGSTSTTVPQNMPPPVQQVKQVVEPMQSNTPPITGKTVQPPTNPSGGKPASITVANGETWTYQGCYSDLIPDRNIRALEKWGQGQTSTECANQCVGAGFKIAGTEFGTQCFCGNGLKQSKLLDDSQCDMPCAGGAETCGGKSALSVYAKDAPSLISKKRRHVRRHVAYAAESL